MRNSILGLLLIVVLNSPQSGPPAINITGNTFQFNVIQTK